MRISDVLIINLACGAPFAVYYFIKNHDRRTSAILWLKTSLVAVFWFLFAIKLSHEGVTNKLNKLHFGNKSESDSLLRRNFEDIEKKFAQILLNSNTGVSIFGFRETFNRYWGLTITDNRAKNDEKKGVNELFQVVRHENPEIASICLNRRNRSKFELHQKNARKDFLKLISNLSNFREIGEKIRPISLEFAAMIPDEELIIALDSLFEKSSPKSLIFEDEEMEIKPWNKDPLPKQLTVQ